MTCLIFAIALSMATGSAAEEATAPQKLKIVVNAQGVEIETSMFWAMAPSLEYNGEAGRMVLSSSATSQVRLHLLEDDSEIRASRITLFLNTSKMHAEGIERLE